MVSLKHQLNLLLELVMVEHYMVLVVMEEQVELRKLMEMTDNLEPVH